jgi:hypothetical protein
MTSRSMTWPGHAARIAANRNTHKLLEGNSNRKIPLESPRRGWVVTIKMDLRWDRVFGTGLVWLGMGKIGEKL